MSQKSIQYIADQLARLAPQAWGYAAHIRQVDAIITVVQTLAFMAIAMPLACYCFGRARRFSVMDETESGVLWIVATVTTGIGALLSVGMFFATPWDWVSIFNPQLGLAHDIFEKLMSR
ncbi:MAG: hypothetical protein GIW99_10195 [Candidatus Eremiobacteraeota bacterium]|nr:hypothetical protein [Candidatus Eremiobacteraeota bacterium]MBC5828031.1 hypothetical protein [Candidatus Eremiobacteraeota bacterium]